MINKKVFKRGKVVSKNGTSLSDPPKIRYNTTHRKILNDLRKIDLWLYECACEEAQKLGDDYFCVLLKGMDPKKLTVSDRDSLNLYLFDTLEVLVDLSP